MHRLFRLAVNDAICYLLVFSLFIVDASNYCSNISGSALAMMIDH